MIYKELGNTGIKVSQISFGVMRLPQKYNAENKATGGMEIDWEKSVPLLVNGMESGINFFDSHPMYCFAQSELVLGEALKNYSGNRIYVQTKCPLYSELKEGETWRSRLEGSLKRLQLQHIDFYIAHALKYSDFQIRGEAFLEMCAAAKKEGLISHVGFSSHDKPENIMKLIETDLFEAMTVQYSLIDRRNEECIKRAAEKGMAVIIMGPIAGGALSGFPEGVKENSPEKIQSSVELGFRFVLSNPNVSCAISGMSDIGMVQQNVKIASSHEPLTADEVRRLEVAFKRLQSLADLYCTGCEYCLPCPQGIYIPVILRCLILKKVYGADSSARELYHFIINLDKSGIAKDSSVCTECGTCMGKCPQNIEIPRLLKEAGEILGKTNSE